MIYLDNSATTRVLDEAARVALKYMTDVFFNPSSMYAPAVAVEREIGAARERMASMLGAQANEVYYTGGATESNNLAIAGVAGVQRGPRRFITTRFEHPSVHEVFLFLQRAGHEVIYLRNDSNGYIEPSQLASLVNERTALVSVMHVNNEFGAVQNLAAISAFIRRANPDTIFHSDGVQAFTKMPFSHIPADMYSLSGHKFHAPKGIGALMIRKGVKISAVQLGGGQERGMRSGTTNVPGILSMDAALSILHTNWAQNEARMRECKLHLAQGILCIPDTVINGPSPEQGAPHILNASFMGVRGEVLLHALEEKGIIVSTGSACSSNKKGKNRVLEAIGVTGERAEGAIRFSLCGANGTKEMDIVTDTLDETVRQLRRYKRR